MKAEIYRGCLTNHSSERIPWPPENDEQRKKVDECRYWIVYRENVRGQGGYQQYLGLLGLVASHAEYEGVFKPILVLTVVEPMTIFEFPEAPICIPRDYKSIGNLHIPGDSWAYDMPVDEFYIMDVGGLRDKIWEPRDCKLMRR